ncbi:MAG: hypothetical protein JWN70_4477 [Planctomycetaceae bacterium]|nr:hypothetical protein [Planctomycetaceae bacterium]
MRRPVNEISGLCKSCFQCLFPVFDDGLHFLPGYVMTSSKNNDRRPPALDCQPQAVVASPIRPQYESGAPRLTAIVTLLIAALPFLQSDLVCPQRAAAQSTAAKQDPPGATQLIDKANDSVLRAKTAASAKQRDELLQQARGQFEQARQLLQKEAADYEKEWRTFGAFIDAKKEPEQFRRKREAEQKKLRTELSLAILPYQLAQSYDKDHPNHQAALKEAGEKLELLHQKHRSQIVGRYARVYQGKCFEELGEPRKALGIYSELLSHTAEAPVMKKLQAQATHFKLICLNSQDPVESELIEAIARKWIQANPTLLETADGKGILAEQARAAKNRDKKAAP